MKVKIRGRAKRLEAQPPPVAAVDIYPTHPQVPLANAGRQASPQATIMLKEPGGRACTPTTDSPVGVDQNDIDIMSPEGQGPPTTMNVDDNDIEFVHLETRTREFSDAESLVSNNWQKSLLKMLTLSQIPPGGFLCTEVVPGEIIPAMEVLRIEQYSNARYRQFAPYLEPVRCGHRSLI